MSSVVSKKSSFDGTGVEILGDISAGYIINVVREEGEEAVRIPPSISMKLKLHQVCQCYHIFGYCIHVFLI